MHALTRVRTLRPLSGPGVMSETVPSSERLQEHEVACTLCRKGCGALMPACCGAATVPGFLALSKCLAEALMDASISVVQGSTAAAEADRSRAG